MYETGTKQTLLLNELGSSIHHMRRITRKALKAAREAPLSVKF